MKASKEYKDFIRNKKVLIVDPSATLRSLIAKSLGDLGFRVHQVFTASSISGALRVIQQEKPRIVISDYQIDQETSLELFSQIRSYETNLQNRLVLVITNNSSESSVAEAAEEDVDGYLLKPFQKQDFENYFFECVNRKVAPTEYQSLINLGKASLESNDLDGALSCFDRAKRKADRPSLAWYYSAEVLKRKNDFPTALINYKKGLSFSNNHYKCLTGLFDLYRKNKKDMKAYEVLRKIASYFPFNPQRLSDAIELCIRTNHFADLDYYYSIYESLESKPKETQKLLAYSLAVKGIHHLKLSEKENADDSFSKAVFVSQKDPKILKHIIYHLIQYRAVDLGNEYLDRFSANDLGGPEYLSAHYIVSDAMTVLGKSIELGRKLIKSNVHDPEIYRVLIRRTLQAGYRDSAEHLAHQASNRYPEEQERFLEIVYRNRT